MPKKIDGLRKDLLSTKDVQETNMSDEANKLAKAARERIHARQNFFNLKVTSDEKSVHVEPLFPFMGVHEFGAKPNNPDDALDAARYAAELMAGRGSRVVETTARVIPDEPKQITTNVNTDGENQK